MSVRPLHTKKVTSPEKIELLHRKIQLRMEMAFKLTNRFT